MLNVSLLCSPTYFLPAASNPKYSSIRGHHGSIEPTDCLFGAGANYRFFGSYKYKGEYHKPDKLFRNNPYGGFCASL